MANFNARVYHALRYSRETPGLCAETACAVAHAAEALAIALDEFEAAHGTGTVCSSCGREPLACCPVPTPVWRVAWDGVLTNPQYAELTPQQARVMDLARHSSGTTHIEVSDRLGLTAVEARELCDVLCRAGHVYRRCSLNPTVWMYSACWPTSA